MPKLPSTRFPFISLAKGLERAKKIYNADKGGKGVSMAVGFSAWGYSDKSSGGFQTVGALRGYGLLVAEGGKDTKTLRLSDKARLYFQTEIEDDRRRLRAEFAQTPPLFAHLVDHWDHGTVEDAVARTYLKTDIGLNDQSARAALGIYKDNLSFAPAKGSAKVEETQPANGNGAASEANTVQQQQQQHTPPGVHTPPPPEPTAGPGLGVVRLAEGGYVIHLSGSVLTKAHADEVIALVTALKPTLPDGEDKTPKQ